MRILCLTFAIQHKQLPGSARQYYFIRELSKRHRICLLALSKSHVSPDILNDLREYLEWLEVFDFSTPRVSAHPGPIVRLRAAISKDKRRREARQQMQSRLRHLLHEERFDVILFHGKSLLSLLDGFDHLPIVCDFCDATSFRLREMLNYVRGWRFGSTLVRLIHARRLEKRVLANISHNAMISERDRKEVGAFGPDDVVVANGVEHDYWQRRSAWQASHTLIFTGVMNYPPNQDAALFLIREIFPRIKEVIPEASLVLAGANPGRELSLLAGKSPDTLLTGYVADLRPYMEEASIYVAPLRFASGIQNKLLEAMAMGMPVVTSAIAAAGLLNITINSIPVKIADGGEGYARTILNLMRNPADCEQLGGAGREFILRHFQWQNSAALLERLCYSAAGLKSEAVLEHA